MSDLVLLIPDRCLSISLVKEVKKVFFSLYARNGEPSVQVFKKKKKKRKKNNPTIIKAYKRCMVTTHTCTPSI